MPDRLAHWNERAQWGLIAGTHDRGAVALEQRVIRAHVQRGMRVLDVGCGLGETLASLEGVEAVGVDFSPEMIARARLAAPAIRFEVGDLMQTWPEVGRFDLIYTQRCLINLPDWPAQTRVLHWLCQWLLNPGGSYLAVENSQTGLDALNHYRRAADLTPITPPWHNRYLVDAEVRALQVEGCRLADDAVDYSSTYYFVSRVLNAWEASNTGCTPSYDAPINQLALQLPVLGSVGQGRYWRWVKA